MTRRTRRRQHEPEDAERDLGPAADPESVARTILLTKLTASAKSRRELADALAAKDVPDDVATTVLDRFEQVGLVDDAAFADTWVRSRQASRGLSRRALSHELRRKGVDDEVIAESLEQVDAETERDAAMALVTRKLRSTRGLDQVRRTRRLVGMLARKGYGPGLAAGVVREALAADALAEEADVTEDMSGIPAADDMVDWPVDE
jgi:regulatory protein